MKTFVAVGGLTAPEKVRSFRRRSLHWFQDAQRRAFYNTSLGVPFNVGAPS